MLKRAYSLLISDKPTDKLSTAQYPENTSLCQEGEECCLKRRKVGYGYREETRGHFFLQQTEHISPPKNKVRLRSHRYAFPKETDFRVVFSKENAGFGAGKQISLYSRSTQLEFPAGRRNGEGSLHNSARRVDNDDVLSNIPDYPEDCVPIGIHHFGHKRLSTPAHEKLRCDARHQHHNSSYMHSSASTTIPSTSWDDVSNCTSLLHNDTTVDSLVLTSGERRREQMCNWKEENSSKKDSVFWALHEGTATSQKEWGESPHPSMVGTTGASVPCQVETQRRRSSGVRVSAFRIDGGYIITPGNHRVLINNCIMNADNDALNISRAALRPAAAALATYAHDMYIKWRLLEDQLDKRTFQLSFRPRSDLERFRQMALQCILHYGSTSSLSFSTLHGSVHNVHRVLLYYVKQKKVRLTASMFFGTLAACLRMALKHEETPEVLRPFRESPDNVWRRLGLEGHSLSHVNTAYVNTVEVDCLMILKDPLTPPSAPDYLDRYLTVGGWPSRLIPAYRELALYLTSLALFSRMEVDQLAGIPPSLIAACALSLAVKVISAGSEDGYEFWPQRLIVYSGYSIDDLRLGIRGLSTLLRRKPSGSDVLHRFHPVWGRYSWK